MSLALAGVLLDIAASDDPRRELIVWANMIIDDACDHAGELSEVQRPAIAAATVFTLREAQRIAIETALVKTQGNKMATARLLDISRTSLYRNLRKHQVPK